MGNKRVPKLVLVENESAEMEKENREFMEHLKNALLLALLDRGILNAGQYQYAREKLNKERKGGDIQWLSQGKYCD